MIRIEGRAQNSIEMKTSRALSTVYEYKREKGPDQQDRFYRNRSSLPDFVTGTGSYRNRFYRKFPMVPSGPLVTGLEPVWTGPEPVLTGSFMYR
ncbi:hypothetical protein H5410_058098 [Solanum commersonii]|uniref:Uncharacterized protein n=1 Tax=Solanum commersonii TaxID=4109 RepID=A0A9J5WS34_SOLCO|nr:hypothetical protein H5410_058098 [Solanum commersonii]